MFFLPKILKESNGFSLVTIICIFFSQARDQVGIIRRVGEACEIQSVSIYAVLQTPIVDPTDVHFVVTTESASLSRVLAACQTISEQDFCIERPFVMPILSG